MQKIEQLARFLDVYFWPVFAETCMPSRSPHMHGLILFDFFSKTTFGDIAYLSPLDTRQFLYCLRPVPGVADFKTFHGVTVIGKLDIIWKSNMGEKGRLQTSPLQRMVSFKESYQGLLHRVV